MAYTDPDHEQDLIEWEREFRDAGEPFTGDARRCPRHPEVATSSADGQFDGLCGLCEQEADDAGRDEELADLVRRAEEAKAVIATPEWQAEAARRAALRASGFDEDGYNDAAERAAFAEATESLTEARQARDEADGDFSHSDGSPVADDDDIPF